MRRLFQCFVVVGFAGLVSACASPPLYYWGEYEESLYLRATDTSEESQAEAVRMLERTINEAEGEQGRPAPGVYADYGYLLFKQGRGQEAVVNFKKEAELYPESRHLMNSVISRIQNKEKL